MKEKLSQNVLLECGVRDALDGNPRIQSGVFAAALQGGAARFALFLLIGLALPVLCGAAGVAMGDEGLTRTDITLAIAQPLIPTKITATGRVCALVRADIGARVAGRIAQFGADANGQMLDVGSPVKAGQILFKLEETTFRDDLAVADASLKLAQANLDNTTAATREEKVEQLRQALAELDARLADRQREQERYRRLVEIEKTLPVKRLEEVQIEVAVLKAQRLGAEARLQEATNGATRWEVAVAQAKVNEAQASLRIAQDNLRDSNVAAPFDGTVTRRYKSPGDYVTSTPHTEVIEVVATDRLEADLHLPEAYLGAVRAGTTRVLVKSPLLEGDLNLPVSRVIPMVDTAAGTFTVRATIPPEHRGVLVAGAFLTADVEVSGRGQAVIVPAKALVMEGPKAYVFVAEDGKMVRHEVQLGDRLTEGVVVQSGVTTGQQVVLGPPGSLSDGAALPTVQEAEKKQ